MHTAASVRTKGRWVRRQRLIHASNTFSLGTYTFPLDEGSTFRPIVIVHSTTEKLVVFSKSETLDVVLNHSGARTTQNRIFFQATTSQIRIRRITNAVRANRTVAVTHLQKERIDFHQSAVLMWVTLYTVSNFLVTRDQAVGIARKRCTVVQCATGTVHCRIATIQRWCRSVGIVEIRFVLNLLPPNAVQLIYTIRSDTVMVYTRKQAHRSHPARYRRTIVTCLSTRALLGFLCPLQSLRIGNILFF
mmetsp:Transcript_14013/g.35796  ORF Transcript_14013/g.35796 Transcript_14013/m.35796 type:complete len:247 (-) Transcript_14013:388-1128(-)